MIVLNNLIEEALELTDKGQLDGIDLSRLATKIVSNANRRHLRLSLGFHGWCMSRASRAQQRPELDHLHGVHAVSASLLRASML